MFHIVKWRNKNEINTKRIRLIYWVTITRNGHERNVKAWYYVPNNPTQSLICLFSVVLFCFVLFMWLFIYLFIHLFIFYSDFSPILVPLQSAMTVTLPSGAGSHKDHNPFPGSLACIVGFEDTVSNVKTMAMASSLYFREEHYTGRI